MKAAQPNIKNFELEGKLTYNRQNPQQKSVCDMKYVLH